MLEIYEKPFPCVITHAYGCPCLFDPKFSKPLTKAKVRHLLNAYLSELKHLIGSGRYDTKEDFTVVLQPSLVQTDLPRHQPTRASRMQVNLEYLAPDCFHFAQKTHALAAKAYWNNLLQPNHMKTSRFTKTSPLLCPTEELPFLATGRNSVSKSQQQMGDLAGDYHNMVDTVGKLQCPL